ncbi:MAG TPA: hypothetical protein VLI94_07435 [Solirubrobacterales bacterium]|nr:hypothetical protein [Solirubrobacterales bacterium]
MILFGSLLGGEGSDEAEASAPAKSRGALLAETRRNAEADAIRHAESLLEREFPIVDTAERTAESTLADLRSTYTEERGELEAKREGVERKVEVAETRLHQTEALLREAGVPEAELGLPPSRKRGVQPRDAAAAIGGVALAVLVLSQLVSGLPLVALGALAAAGLIFGLTRGPVEETEPTRLRRLREHRQEIDRERQGLLDQQILNAEAIELLDRRTYSRGLSDIAFAGELVAAYANAAFSALPAGSLEGGREFAAQRQPHVEIPAWLEALAPEDE